MRRTLIILPLAAMALAACEARNLYVAHDTVVGINAKLNNGRQHGQLLIGYDRDFATVIPKSVDLNKDGERDVMSLIHCSDLEVDGIYIGKYYDVTATGDAAINLAQENGGAATFLKDCNIGG